MTEFLRVPKGCAPIFGQLETFSMLVMPETTITGAQGVTFFKTRYLNGITTKITNYSGLDLWSTSTGSITMNFSVDMAAVESSRPQYEMAYTSIDIMKINGN